MLHLRQGAALTARHGVFVHEAYEVDKSRHKPARNMLSMVSKQQLEQQEQLCPAITRQLPYQQSLARHIAVDVLGPQ